MAESLIFNGELMDARTFGFSSANRAFQYGDGLFETIRYEAGKIWFWDDHVQRLSTGMEVLALHASFTADELAAQLTQLLTANALDQQAARIKLQVWRQPGGLYTPSSNAADYLLTAGPGSAFSVTTKENVAVFEDVRLMPSPLSACKTLNALPYVLAGIYKQKNGLDDVMLLDQHGHLAECLASNLFWIKGETLFTPSLQTGCINGILRRQLLRAALVMGLEVVDGLHQPNELAKAEAIFCSNVMGVQWIQGPGYSLHETARETVLRLLRQVQS